MAIDTWTEARIGRLRSLYSDGYSCSMIAADLGGGISRNSVIGKVHRLKLSLRGGGARQPKEESRTRAPREHKDRPVSHVMPRIIKRAAAREAMRCIEIEPRHLSLFDLEPNDCRYPYGDGPFTFCGNPKFNGSYCIKHFYLSIGPGTGSERAAHRVAA